MNRIDRLLGLAVEQKEVLRAARAQRAFAQWATVVGSMLASRSWPDRYERGTVFVAVQGSAWAQELRMHKDTILFRLDEIAAEKGLFRQVRFGVRPLPKARQSEAAPTPSPERRIRTPREIAAKWFGEAKGEDRA